MHYQNDKRPPSKWIYGSRHVSGVKVAGNLGHMAAKTMTRLEAHEIINRWNFFSANNGAQFMYWLEEEQ